MKYSEMDIETLRRLSENGDYKASLELGIKLRNTEKKYKEAFELFQTAVEHGIKRSYFYLGYAYHTGQGVEKSVEEAMKWYLRSVEEDNDKVAMNNIGVIYEEVYHDRKNTRKWYKKAIDAGDKLAIQNMAKILENNYRDDFDEYFDADDADISQMPPIKDIDDAIQYYIQAAEAGYKYSQKRLSEILYGKAGGHFYNHPFKYHGKYILRNEREAYKWKKRYEENK